MKGGNTMKYTLMHTDIAVADIDIDEATGSIRRIDTIYDEKHLPVGVSVRHGIADRASLNEWWCDRSIPASRSGLRAALEELNVSSSLMLLTRCLGLSLSDGYWIKPSGAAVSWHDVNFFENPFSEDIGNALFGYKSDSIDVDFHSPDNTSDGFLKKRWKIIDGKRCLIKAGTGPYNQQPFCEVIASCVADRLGIPHVSYSLLWMDDVPYSVCEDFITKNTELISAWRVMQTQKRDNSTSVYRHYINCCEALGMDDITHSVDQMIVLDYVIANEDRHQNNFGVVRRSDTLEWIGAAPIFDSGSSLGYDKLPSAILSGKDIGCKPFKKKHEDQLKLITSLDWIDFGRLRGVEEVIRTVFSDASEYIDERRINAIVASVNRRIDNLEQLAMSMRNIIDDTNDDIAEDVAEDYGFGIQQ